MDREKLKVMIKDLKNVVNALECEIYSDKESYTLNLNYDEIVNQITDYDEVFEMMTGNSDDPRYSEEKLLLRAACFRCLTHHLEEHTRAVYEFATIWCDEHDNVGGIEQGFQDYLRSYAEKAFSKS